MPNSASSKKSRLFSVVSLSTLVAIITLGIVNLVLTNFLNIDGLILNSCLAETAIISKENQELQTKLSQTKSLSLIGIQAKNLGFVQAKKITTVNSIDTVAQVPN